MDVVCDNNIQHMKHYLQHNAQINISERSYLGSPDPNGSIIEFVLEKMGNVRVEWFHLAHDMVQQQVLVNIVMKFLRSINGR